jgi:soluble lytic murein transglycosylase-like protein
VERFRSLIDQAAQRHHLDAALLAAVVHVESGGNPQASRGSRGLTQLIPPRPNVSSQRPFDPARPRRRGICKGYWGSLGVTSPKLRAYNAGGNVKNTGHPRLRTGHVPAVLAAMIRIANRRQLHPAPLHQDPQHPTGRLLRSSQGILPPPRHSAWPGS